MSPRGVASGFLKMTVLCTDAADPPCNPTNGTDTEDLRIQFFQSDVLCAVGGIGGCTAAGADYTGPLVVRSSLRITDHANGSPAAVCTNGLGNPPCRSATVQDTNWSFLVACTATPSSANGSTCQTTTTMDTLVPNTVREFQRAVVSVLSTGAFDMGPDGAVGGGCPPACGTGDETRYLQQTILTP